SSFHFRVPTPYLTYPHPQTPCQTPSPAPPAIGTWTYRSREPQRDRVRGPSPEIQHRQRTQTSLTRIQGDHTDNLKLVLYSGRSPGRLSYINNRLPM
uniref:Uncharacterized protein n=1 Tax=Sinocyclocheilus anshuiensis TaxID=1608454 RepID=A0A671MGS4_9TELE